jgi:hypothetical protein
MIRVLVVCLACLSVAKALPVSGDQPKGPIPMIVAVTPATAKAGDALIASGTLLDKSAVANLYMIQGENTIEVKITSQTEDAINFVVPQSVKAGHYNLMVLTKGAIPQYVEEPVLVTVE